MVGPSVRGTHHLRVVHSPDGEPEGTLVWPFDRQALATRLEAFDIARRAPARGVAPGLSRLPGRAHSQSPTGTTRAEAMETVEGFGRELFDLLMPEAIGRCYNRSAAIAKERGKGLRLRLRIEAPNLAALPWEFIFDRSTRPGAYLGLSPLTPITRYLQVERPPGRMHVEPPLRILGMVALPNDLQRLAASRERGQMETAIKHLTDTNHVKLDWVEGGTRRDLQRKLRPNEGPWHVFHFIGHGAFDEESGEGLLVMTDDEGNSDPVSATTVAGLLGGHPTLRMAVFNSCEGSLGDPDDAFSSTAAIVVRQGLPAVVAMQYEITDRAAIEFSRAFYDWLADKYPVDMAVTEARKAILNHWDQNTVEWGTPVLHMRAPDGELFEIDVPSAVFQPKGEAAPAPAQPDPTPGVPSMDDLISHVLPESSRDKEQVRRGLITLRKKVKRFWVDGALASMLERSPLIELELELLRAAVASPFGDEPSGSVEILPPDQKIADVFDEEGGSLLILGEPGAGKTTTLLALCSELLKRVEGQPELPVPIVVNLIGWAGQPLDEWLAAELSSKYTIPKRITRRCLSDRRLLPLMDGLDEVGAATREACVGAINHFAAGDLSIGAVVSSRYKEYTELASRLRLNSAVRLRQLTREQVAEHVRERGPRLEGLRDVLRRDSALQIEARSPLMLGIMERAYSDLPPGQLDAGGAETAEARRQHILDTYVDRMFQRQGEGVRSV